jgi:hypothetical protein
MDKNAKKVTKGKKSKQQSVDQSQSEKYGLFDFTKINPQINGFDGDIYDPNLKIDVFDPYFYQVMITRFYYYMFNHITTYKDYSNAQIINKGMTRIINNTYNTNNFQGKAQEFFSMIEMPDHSDPKYKEALIRIFILTLFETKYNYQCKHVPNPNGYLSRGNIHRNELDDDFQYTFLKYYLEDSIYKDDFKNLIKDDDLDDLQLPFIDIEYIYPQDIFEKFKLLISYIPNGQAIFTRHNIINNQYLINYPGIYDYKTIQSIWSQAIIFRGDSLPNYNDTKTSVDKVTKSFRLSDSESSMPNHHDCNYLFEIYNAFYGNLWNLLRKRTNIYHFKINDNLYIPIVYPKLLYHGGDYIEDYILKINGGQTMGIPFDYYFENLSYFDQNTKGKLLTNLFAKKYIFTIIGYLIYKDDCQDLQSIITSYLVTLKMADNQKFVLYTILLLSSSIISKITENKINTNKIIEKLLESNKNLINKLSPKNCNKLYRDILKKFYKSPQSIDSSLKKTMCQLCDVLHQKSLSMV